MKSTTAKAPLLTIPQVMERLSVCYDTAWSLVRHGDLPAVKIGSTWRVDEVDLEAFIAKRKQASQRLTPAAAVAAAVDADRQFDGEENPFL